MQYRVSQLVALVGLVVGLSGCAGLCGRGGETEKGEKAVLLSDVPAPARATIERLTAGGEIKKIDKEETGGKAVYDVEARVKGKDVEYDVASDGSILSSEESVPYASLPAKVRAAAEKYFGSPKDLKASREVEGGKTFYEVEGAKAGAKIALKLTDTGQIVEEEEE